MSAFEEINNILVTGGAGFIGSHFIRHLLKSDPSCRVLNVDALTYAGDLSRLEDLPAQERHLFFNADIRDSYQMGKIFARYPIKTVVHFAAESHVDNSIDDDSTFYSTNVMGTGNLLKLCRDHFAAKGDRGQRFLYISTDEVYGSRSAPGSFNELDPLKPGNPYSASKAAGEMLVMAYHQTFAFPGIITRSSNNYGPHQLAEKLIPKVILRALAGQPIPIYGDGSQIRDWLYVEDHCAALTAVIRHGQAGETYNIAGGNEVSNLTLVRRILKLLQRPESLLEFVPDRPGHDQRYSIDKTKIKETCRWLPQTDLSAGLKKTIDSLT